MTGVVCWFTDDRKQIAFERRLEKFFKQFEKIQRKSKKNV